MKLPGAEHAIIEIGKLRDYCLSPTHPRGRHKACAFASSFQLLQSDAEWFRTQLLDAVVNSDAVKAEADEYGTRYIVDFLCISGTTSARVG